MLDGSQGFHCPGKKKWGLHPCIWSRSTSSEPEPYNVLFRIRSGILP